ncbi:hypothetical protein ACWCQL_13205 [Streptomyces sp. NPDC002073]
MLVLRFPLLKLTTWYRIAEIARHRGTLPETKFRLAKFLNTQRLSPTTGWVEGRYGTDQVDGGVALSERYAYVHEVGTDRFWDDLKGLKRAGFAERVQAPAPGRRAVYALCLRADAIPSDLPDDLTRDLKVWDLPDAEDPFEDAAYGRLTTRQAPAVEPLVVRGENAETRRLLADLAAAPRWEHQPGSKAAVVAGAIRDGAKRAGTPLPDLRCTAVADPERAAEMTTRFARLLNLGVDGKPSPLYAKAHSQLVGYATTGSTWHSSAEQMRKTKTTPSATLATKDGAFVGDDPAVVASRVRTRVWASWRLQLGRGEVFLPAMTPEEASRSLTGDAWSDLHLTITIALTRGATESELVELLTHNVIRHDRWGRVTFRATNVGRLAGYRLWKWISANPHPAYRRTRTVRQADHVTRWDEASQEARDRARGTGTWVRERNEMRARAEAEAYAASRAERLARWGLDRWINRPELEPATAETPQRRVEVPTSSTVDGRYAAAVAMARADKRARRLRGTS